ncbi:MAG: ANTAR domain-containing response regulator [Candidatus Methylomirabilales bacterium]
MSYRVLLIDDSPSARALLRDSLRGLGCSVVGEATEAQEGLRLAQALQPDLIFLAVGLPGVDGITTATWIMKEAPTPIILLTRHRDPATIRRATEAGVMAYLIKPVQKEGLQPAIALAIARFREFMALWKDNQHLRRALETRKKIERAKGLLMVRRGISEAEAFSAIQRQSMKSRTPMDQIAEAILVAEAVAETTTDPNPAPSMRPQPKITPDRFLRMKGGN